MESKQARRAGGRRRLVCLLPLLLGLAQCGMVRDQTEAGRVSVTGVRPTVEQIDFDGVTGSQNRLIEALRLQSQLDRPLQSDDAAWGLLTRAGIQMVGAHCDRYLDALFRFNREQRAAHQGLSAVGAASAGIMGLTGAAGAAVAAVATAFGLADTLFDASVGSVLFQVEPSALRNVVLRGRQLYLDGLAARTGNLRDIRTRPDMMIALQGYLTQCSPAAIEANINNAANGSPFAITQPGLAPGSFEAAVATGTPAIGLLGSAQRPAAQTLKPPPPAPSEVDLPGLRPEERPLSVAQLQRVQAALGVAPAAGLDAATRTALGEFQRAMAARDAAWRAVPPGLLVGATRRTLLTAPPMPAGFASTFERFYLGNARDRSDAAGSLAAFSTVDPRQMRNLRDLLGLPPAPVAGEEPWAGLRDAIARRRAAAGLPPGTALDAALFERITPD